MYPYRGTAQIEGHKSTKKDNCIILYGLLVCCIPLFFTVFSYSVFLNGWYYNIYRAIFNKIKFINTVLAYTP